MNEAPWQKLKRQLAEIGKYSGKPGCQPKKKLAFVKKNEVSQVSVRMKW